MVDDGEHPAGRGDAQGLGEDGWWLRRRGKLQLGKLPTAEEFGGGWDYNYDEVLRGGRGREVYLQKTAGSKSWGMNWDEDEGGGEYPNAYFFYLPRMCNHCTQPACVEACPSGAMFKREEDGLVLRDEDVCQGSPGLRAGVSVQEDLLQRDGEGEPALHRLFPAAGAGRGAGLRASVSGPGGVRGLQGRRGERGVQAGGEVEGGACRCIRSTGRRRTCSTCRRWRRRRFARTAASTTGGERIPPSYLEELFGPAVHGAMDVLRTELDKKRRGLDSELMDQLILYRWQDCLGHLSRDPADIVWK